MWKGVTLQMVTNLAQMDIFSAFMGAGRQQIAFPVQCSFHSAVYSFRHYYKDSLPLTELRYPGVSLERPCGGDLSSFFNSAHPNTE